MTSNHEEYINNITLENLKHKFTEVLPIFAEKVAKEIEKIKLGFRHLL